MTDVVVQSLTIYPLAIPLRSRVKHATAERVVADPVVVAVELRDGTIGYGETLPREYVTGESVESVIETISTMYATLLTTFHPTSFAVALDAIDALPWYDAQAKHVPAARAAVELALLDAVLKSYDRTMEDVVQWMGLPGFGWPGSIQQIRFSGVIATESIPKALRQLRLMYWYGLRDFKLKIGFRGDVELRDRIYTYLHKPIAAGKASLRVDVNGAWKLEGAQVRLGSWNSNEIASVEQPLPRGQEEKLKLLRESTDIPFMHDESLITVEDAKRLIELGVADGFNIRLSKCGGMMPSLRLAALARKFLARIQLGCMVGETSILSSAALRFLEVCPGATWAEGCFGKLLMKSDIVKSSLRFGYGGRPPRLSDGGIAGAVAPSLLEAACLAKPITFHL